jgi:hypothetical protein
MRERKVVSCVFTKSECITSDGLIEIYDARINEIISSESKNGWSIISCTPVFCNDSSEIIYTMIFEKCDTVDENNAIADLIPHIYGCKNERKCDEQVTYKRTVIDTSGDDEFKQLIKTEYPKAPNYIKYMIEDYKHRYYINVTRNYEDIGMTSIHDWIENNKNKYAIPKPIPATDAIIGTITIACVDDNVRGFITYGELLKYDNDKYIVRTSIEKSTTTIKVIYFKPFTKERDVK